MVRTTPIKRLNDFIEQRKRWLRGGIRVNIWGWIMMVVSFAVHLLMTVGVFMNVRDISAILAVLVLDYSLMWRIARRINIRISLQNFLAYELFYIFYSVVLITGLIFRSPVHWKERTYTDT